MDLRKYIELYLSEGRDHLSNLTQGLKNEDNLSGETISSLFRSAHSLKGMASSMGFESTSKVAHSLEDLLSKWRNGEKIEITMLERALRGTDLLESLFEAVEKKGNDEGFEKDVSSWLNEKEKSDITNENLSKSKDLKKEAKEELPKKGSTIKVEIDPNSSLPAARLLIVFQKIKSFDKDAEISPTIEEIQSKGIKSAEFYLSEIADLNAIGRTVETLPEVINVTVEKKEEGETTLESSLISYLKIPAKSLDDFLFRISHLIYHLNNLERSLSKEEGKRQKFWIESHRSFLEQLYNEILETRLVPFDSLIERCERCLRDVSSKTGKRVKFTVEGKGEKVDKVLLERLLDPLSHLIRNAVDHGIENSEERKKKGKEEEGKIVLSIKRDGEKLTISFRDDGKGLDHEAIKANAIKNGLITIERANALSEREILDLITLPSFSTKKEVSQISGRGVGLDVVKASVESLGGTLEMTSEKGEGTTFYLVFPSAVTLTEVLVFSWKNKTPFAIPTSQVTKLYPLKEYPVEWVEGVKKLRVGEEFIEILNFRLTPIGRDGTAIGLNFPDVEKVFLVEEVFKTEKVVILPFGKPLERVPNLIGGALLSSGDIVFILDGLSFTKSEMEAMNVFKTQ